MPSVRSSGEGIQDGLITVLIHLEDGSKAVRAAAGGCTLEVAVRISQQAAVWNCSIRSSGEAIQHGFFSGGSHLEDHSAAGQVAIRTCANATAYRGSVKVTGRVPHQAIGITSVAGAPEGVERL